MNIRIFVPSVLAKPLNNAQIVRGVFCLYRYMATKIPFIKTFGVTTKTSHIAHIFAISVWQKVKNVKSSSISYQYRTCIATFLPFRGYSIDNQLIIDTNHKNTYFFKKNIYYSQRKLLYLQAKT
jgi:hypothetical protein